MQSALIVFLCLIRFDVQEKASMPFLLDSSKPYVYLAFDHAGDRTPIYPGEDKKGIWFKFVNNCRIPVAIKTFDPGNGDPGIGLQHEVIPIPTASFGGILSSTDKSDRGQGRAELKPPAGYSADLATLKRVEPGESVLFSVPLNHLSPQWYLRVEFTLDVSGQRGDQPFSHAEFRWEALPRSVREMSPKEIR